MSQFESFEVDLSAQSADDGEPVVRRRGVTFGVVENEPQNGTQVNGCADDASALQINGGCQEEAFQPASNFIDDLDFLENCGGNNDDAMEQLQRKSLYVKFDPLCKSPGKSPGGKPPGTPAAATQPYHLVQPVVGGSPKIDLTEEVFFPTTSEDTNGLHDMDKSSSAMPGAIITNGLDELTSEDVPHSPSIPNGVKNNTSFTLSSSFTSSAKESNETLLNNTAPLAPVMNLPNGDLVEPLLYSQSDMDEWIKRARDDFAEEMRAREIDWQAKYTELENNIKEEVAMRELIEKDNAQKVECLRRETTDMKQVLSQYEMTIVELTENSHLDARENEKSVAETVRAKEQMQEDLNTAEQAVFDAFKRIEKLKQTVDKLTQNEATLKRNSDELNQKLEKSEEKYQKLKVQAEEKIDNANTVIEKVRKQQEIDIAGLQASLKLAQSKVKSLELEIQQKSLDNAQLTQLCDDLIEKVSRN